MTERINLEDLINPPVFVYESAAGIPEEYPDNPENYLSEEAFIFSRAKIKVSYQDITNPKALKESAIKHGVAGVIKKDIDKFAPKGYVPIKKSDYQKVKNYTVEFFRTNDFNNGVDERRDEQRAIYDGNTIYFYTVAIHHKSVHDEIDGHMVMINAAGQVYNQSRGSNKPSSYQHMGEKSARIQLVLANHEKQKIKLPVVAWFSIFGRKFNAQESAKIDLKNYPNGAIVLSLEEYNALLDMVHIPEQSSM